jgi:hypothetical protein
MTQRYALRRPSRQPVSSMFATAARWAAVWASPTTGAKAVLVACSNSLTLPNATFTPQTSAMSWTTSRRLSR